MKKTYSAKQKAALALAAIRGEKVNDLASHYQINPNLIHKWKKTVEEQLEQIFSDKRQKENLSKDSLIEELYKSIGQREVEINWLKKKLHLELPREIDPSRSG